MTEYIIEWCPECDTECDESTVIDWNHDRICGQRVTYPTCRCPKCGETFTNEPDDPRIP